MSCLRRAGFFIDDFIANLLLCEIDWHLLHVTSNNIMHFFLNSQRVRFCAPHVYIEVNNSAQLILDVVSSESWCLAVCSLSLIHI